jgi:succinate dehydrogenase/fumarate reductase flavoprotein subunit
VETWLAVLLVVMAFRHSRVTADAVIVAAGPIARVYAPTRGANGYLTMVLYPAVTTSFDGRTPQLFPVEHCAAIEK